MSDKIHFHNLSIKDIYNQLHTSEKGLSSQEALKRTSKYGYNELPTKKKTSLIKQFLAQFNDFMIIILIIAAGISFVASIIEGNADYADPIIILTIIVFNAVMGVIQESKAEHSLESLKKLSAPYANVLRDGIIQVIPSRELVPGDIISLETGNLVPADVRIINCSNLKIDESSLTGESMAVNKNSDISFPIDTPLADRRNMVYSSSIVTCGHGTALVVATGINTEVGHIAKLINDDTSPETPLQKNLATTSKYLGIFALAICFIIFAIGVFQGRGLFEMFMTSISLAVASIPEGLPIIVTIVLSLGVSKMAEHKAIIRKLPAVETLGSATYVCSDKTGTLTQNKMTVTAINDAHGPMKNIDFILSLACLCNNSQANHSKSSDTTNTHHNLNAIKKITDSHLKQQHNNMPNITIHGEPTENALIYAGINNNIFKEDLEKRYPRVDEIPFDSKRKLMTTIHKLTTYNNNNLSCNHNSKKTNIINNNNNHSKIINNSTTNNSINKYAYRCITKGAVEFLLDKCTNYYNGSSIIPLTSTLKRQIKKTCDSMTKDALRVLGVAFKDSNSSTEEELCFVGLIGMIDPPRPEAFQAVKNCKLAGITPVMITGDHPYTALAIANNLDICNNSEEIITGTELDKFDDGTLVEKVKNYKVFARVTPLHKVKIVKALQQNNEIVAMTGDGVNDAPALKAADIGCSMGINGTDVAKNASDMILADDNFATIVEAIKRGRGIYENIRKSIHFLLSCNIGEIISILFAILFRLPTPLLAIQLLWINLVTDSLPAISLGVEPIDENILHKKNVCNNNTHSQKHNSSFFTKDLVSKIVFEGFLIGLLTLIAFIIGYKILPTNNLSQNIQSLNLFSNTNNNPNEITLIIGRTMAFATLGLSQLFHSFNMKTNKSLLSINIFNNKKLIGSFIVCAFLQISVITIPTLANIFKVIPLDLFRWVIVIALSFAPIILVELQKKCNKCNV